MRHDRIAASLHGFQPAQSSYFGNFGDYAYQNPRMDSDKKYFFFLTFKLNRLHCISVHRSKLVVIVPAFVVPDHVLRFFDKYFDNNCVEKKILIKSKLADFTGTVFDA